MRSPSASRVAPASYRLFALAALALFGACSDAPRSTVDDRAGLLAPAERAQIETFHGLLLADHDIDYHVVTAVDAGDLSRAAIDTFAARQVGIASTTGRGLLLLIDPAQNQVRLEVSAALEGVYVDAFVAHLEQRQMVPFFQRRRIADGILATTELIVERAIRAQRQAGFDGEVWTAFSAGGGATSEAGIGQAPSTSTRGAAIVARGDEPAAVVQAYLDAMSARNANPNSAIFSNATREMLAKWVVTPAQMDNIARTYRDCHAEAPQIEADRAVIRYAPAERACAPWFLIKEDGDWRLDLTMMQGSIRFGRNNAWHFTPGAVHPYRFAFADWRFDANGFPLIPD